MPVKAPPVVAPAFNWTGFYIGVHGGGAWLQHQQVTTPNNGICAPGLAFDAANSCNLNTSGGAFGGFAGFNYQSGRVVFGIEADASWVGLNRSANFPDLSGLGPFMTMTAKVDWLATVRGRVGITMSPTLLYVTGGAAFASLRSSWTDNSPPPAPNAAIRLNSTRVGWVVGGGVEHAFARNWLVRVEGLYHDFGTVTGGPAIESGSIYNTSFRHRLTTVRGGIALRW
jgi:outer membrane immunogenic protein